MYKKYFYKAVLFLFFALLSCNQSKAETSNETQGEKKNVKSESPSQDKTYVKKIKSIEHFEEVLEESGDRLLVFDLYADWCGPCKMLAPVLEEVAEDYAGCATIYKIDTQKHRQLAGAFGVRGIPHVTFIRNKKAVDTITGFRPKEEYAKRIESYKSDADSCE